MKKKFKEVIIFSALLVLFLILLNFDFLADKKVYAQRDLEVTYPTIQGFKPQSVTTPLADYVKYIFNFIITIVGLIAFGALVFGGIRYLTSAGKPEELKKAKKQIQSAFLGIILLLFSYLILITINPQLIIFRPSEIEPIPEPSPYSPPLVPSPPAANPLERIKQLSEAAKRKAGEMKSVAEALPNLINNCDCGTTQPLCLCKNYYGSCSPDNVNPCYSARTTQPCPDDREIKNRQLTVIAQRDDMIYYKNRAEAEAQDLKAEIEKVINKKIKWYEERIAAEKKILEQIKEEIAKDLEREIIRYLEEGKARKEAEKDYKERLKEKLLELANAIEGLREPGKKISELPNECLTNVPRRCQGRCIGGCHDTWGCFPLMCIGGNPCPTQEIQRQIDSISNSYPNIARIADEIIAIVSQLGEG